MIFIPENVKIALHMLQNNNYEAYIVGGCVRDALLGDIPKDYDITTSAEPFEVKQVFKNYRIIETGIKHGTVTVLINKEPLEITTFRIDENYSDNRHPESVTFTKSLKEDTARRDFTMNAISYNEKTGLCDFYGGISDIQEKIIRCVGNPDERFKEDALRIMRALRFASVLDFSIEPETESAIFRNKNLIKNISSERIASELIKLLCGKKAKYILIKYIDIIGAVIPELLPMKNFEQHNIHHIYDVLTHTAVAVDSIDPEPILRLAALFHDIGKPDCFFMKNGQGHFYGHAAKSEVITQNILTRLKLDNNTKAKVCKLVKIHDVQIEDNDTAVKRCLNKHTPEIYFMLLKLKRADTLAQAPQYHDRLQYLDSIKKRAESIINDNSCFSLNKLCINGNDLIEMGMKPGKQLGKTLDMLLEKVMSGKLPNDRNILLEEASKLL